MNRMIALVEKMSWVLPLVLLFGLLVLMLATLHHHLADIRMNARRRHLNIPASRSPGESTRRRIDRTTGEIGAFAVALGTIPLALYGALLSYVHFLFLDLSWIDTVYFGGISAGFILYTSNKINRLKARRQRLYMTYEGQMAVAQEVSRLAPEGHRVYHDFPTDRFHIDHIVVGPNGVFTVTTKVIHTLGRRRENRLSVNGSILRYGKTDDERAIPYAAFQASWLAKWLLTATGEALAVQSILTIPGWQIRTMRPSTVKVMEPAAIGEAIKRLQGQRLSHKTIRLVCEQLETKCRNA
jgi:hypothetical protein